MKAGLVNKKKVQTAKKSKHKEKLKAGKNAVSEAEAIKLRAQQSREEKAERDRHLNLQRQQQATQKAIISQIRQLIELNSIQSRDGEIAYNFTDQRKIKRLYVTQQLLEQLSRGQVAIVTLDEHYHLVPAAVAEKIRLRDASVIIQLNESQPQDDEDDPYADYKIPDDLMW